MSQSSHIKLPHQTNKRYLTDAGFETEMLFKKGYDMPLFAFFPMLEMPEGRREMKEYFPPFMETARQHGAGFILDTNTWRANPDWATQLGYDKASLSEINREGVRFAKELRDEFGAGGDVLINGVVGPRGDGYNPYTIMSEAEAEAYHGVQIGDFADCEVDMVSALTITNVPEAVGIARAAGDRGLPCVISFTVETDGRLPTGQSLGDAITEVDAKCATKPAYYMINCAHPDHFQDMLGDGGDWLGRIQGLRANASRKSHAELDESETLDDGNPTELGQQYSDLAKLLPNLNVFGGCCGTNHNHVEKICHALNAA